jgi:hypothetical protein
VTRVLEGLALLAIGIACLASASCGGAAGGYYVGYGYSGDPYGEVFYRAPVDRYGGGFYGHP